MAKARIRFYNPGGKPFTTSNYWFERNSNGRPMAVTNGENGNLYQMVTETAYRRG